MSDEKPLPEINLSPNNLARVTAALRDLVSELNDKKKPFAPRERTNLVKGKPISRVELEKMVAPENLARIPDDRRDELLFVRVITRDPVIAALASKAVTTFEAIHTLIQGGFGADAYALTRNLFENVVTVDWMLAKDEETRKQRIDTFVLHFEAFLVRFEHVVTTAKQSRGEPLDPDFGTTSRTREISSEVFEDKWLYWSWFKDDRGKSYRVTLKEMAQEVQLGGVYDRDYFEMSAFVHSAPASVFEHSGGPAETLDGLGTFALQPELFKNPRTDPLAYIAHGLSNVLLLQLFTVIDLRLDFGLAHTLDLIRFMHHISDELYAEYEKRLSDPQQRPDAEK